MGPRRSKQVYRAGTSARARASAAVRAAALVAVVLAALPLAACSAATHASGARPSTSVEWWGSDWASANALSGGGASPSFKGFAAEVSLPGSTPPAACGGLWTTSPGNSSAAPSEVPSYMGVLVASSVSKAGSTISGDTVRIVVVRTDPGYAPNPGHPGAGTIVATYCS